MPATTFPPIHPGEHLHEDFMAPLEVSQTRLAHDLKEQLPVRGLGIHRRGQLADHGVLHRLRGR